jgi:hypothetical protein
MWIFLSNGFISAVEDRNDHDQLIIRARTRKHLADIVPESQDRIEHTPKADYHYRLRMPKTELARLMSEAILGIDYDNFKNSITDHRYHDAALSIWAAMHRLQSEVDRDVGGVSDQ